MKSAIGLSVILATYLLGACSEKEDKTSDTKKSTEDIVTGSLYLEPNDYASSGTINYVIDASGLIKYKVNVVYFGDSHTLSKYLPSFSHKFSDSYDALRESVLSSTYKQDGHKHYDSRVIMSVKEAGSKSSKVVGQVLGSDLVAEFELDTSDEVIRIASATLKGTVLKQSISLKLSDSEKAK
jgi:hypothetical protein